jgi:hypothetical protein
MQNILVVLHQWHRTCFLNGMARKVGWGILIALGLLLIANTVPYFSFRRDVAFLEEKGPLASDPIWRRCFYGHLLGSVVCLALVPYLFWDRLRRRFPALHRGLGRCYGVAVLGWAAPTGLYLSFHAKGGLAGKSAFLLLGVLWWATTARGVQTAVARRFDEHRRWMVRSAAIAGSAVFFRIFHVAFFGLGLADEPNYVLSLWLSAAASLIAGEAFGRGVPSKPPSLLLKGEVS